MAFRKRTATMFLTAASMVVVTTVSAQSAPVLDGSGFGAPSAIVLYDPGAPTGNFDSPGPTTSGAAYDIYMRGDASYAYVLLTQTGLGISAGPFANLYFGTGPTAFNGSDVGFEVTNSTVFFPSTGASQSTEGTGIAYAILDGGASIEFAVPFSYLETDPQNVGFNKLTAADPDLVLRLSQSFGYSVAGGATYGVDRLGVIVARFAPSVPEPATWAMIVVGMGAIGLVTRRRQKAASQVGYLA